MPVTTITLGYPAQKLPTTDRLPMQSIVHTERYQHFDAAAIDAIYKEKEEGVQYFIEHPLCKIINRESLF